MRLAVIIILSILVVIILFVVAVQIIIQNPGLIHADKPEQHDKLNNNEIMELNEGDLVLMQGQGVPSEFIILVLDDEIKVSHIGFIVMLDDEPWVIHTVNSSLSGIDGIQKNSISDFISHSTEDTVVIIRPKWLLQDRTYNIRNKAVELAKELYSQEIPFDNDYNPDDKNELYCTELVLLLLKDSGFWPDELEINMEGPFILFGNFVNPDYFDIVIDHRRSR